MASIWHSFVKSLNFYRVHVLFFTFTPLIFACIFYGANGEYKIEFIDCLFLCYSAITSTGLATINLSTCTPFQQVLLFLLILLGGLVSVSWVMVFIRTRFFVSKFEHVVHDRELNRTSSSTAVGNGVDSSSRFPSFLISRTRSKTDNTTPDERRDRIPLSFVRPGMIRRVGSEPRRVDPSGKLSQQPEANGTELAPRAEKPTEPLTLGDDLTTSPRGYDNESDFPHSDPKSAEERRQSAVSERRFPRSQTVEFREPTVERGPGKAGILRHPTIEPTDGHQTDGAFPRTDTLRRTASLRRHSTLPGTVRPLPSRDVGFGGFPSPHVLISKLIRKLFPRFHRNLSRSVSLSAASTLPTASRVAPYLSFPAVVGRNSMFHALTNKQLEEIGGVEYRALKMLLWLVGGYWFGVHLLAFAIISISVTAHGGYKSVFASQYRHVNPVWFSLFQAAAAYSNAGLSLVDQSMVPFSTAYAMVLVMIFAILGGNTAFPIFLRCFIWLISFLVPAGSHAKETLRFLLDHPRRCFVYLFPSRQSWILLVVLIILNCTDWVAFGILDIGNPYVEAIPVGNRIVDGLFQSIAVRTAGFSIVSLGSLSPAVKVLYTIMMYISAYPIALSVRSTNVYEEKSLGIFRDESDSEDEDEPNAELGSFLAWHARKQLAFDVWWLFFALWLVCIIERGNINDPNSTSWFDIFTIMFELVSAYGTNGMSLGIPTENYSLSGAFSPLSKLVVIIVMLRGRHRGLPVAIDRAVVLPYEFDLQRRKSRETEESKTTDSEGPPTATDP